MMNTHADFPKKSAPYTGTREPVGPLPQGYIFITAPDTVKSQSHVTVTVVGQTLTTPRGVAIPPYHVSLPVV